ncbi:MAG: hydrogenase expression/formation protein HypE [Lachnospiraceae bacterium]|nr:hydrogenase expression/formation protein HypE [Lachnospiraceae bacterium]
MIITMAHGSGGRATNELIQEIFADAFAMEQLEDSAVLEGAGTIALTTDSFVVTPVEYPGGNIGHLAVCGTVNDLLMRGAKPKYLTSGFILQEGADADVLRRIVASMAETAKEAGVKIVAGDTKVVEGNGGIIINTAGVGFVPEGRDVSAKNIEVGDLVLLSGNLGDHHATILSQRLAVSNQIESDNAPLTDMVSNLLEGGVRVHCMRDVTRGGLATVLKELAVAKNVAITLSQEKLPVSDAVRDFCGLLGLDPLYMGNEGKLVAFVPKEDAEKALDIMKNSKYGASSCAIGEVTAGNGEAFLTTEIGGMRRLDVLQGEGLPRIC